MFQRRTFSATEIRRSSEQAMIPAGLLSARARCENFALYRRRPLAVSGAYDRSAIMAAAVVAARAHQERHGGTWAAAMSVCLKAAWQVARAARAATAH